MQDTGKRYLSFARDTRHNPWLDLLRSLAIILVLMRHGSRMEGMSPPGDVLANIFANGWIGVDLFFVLSGYLIASGLIRRFETQGALFPAGYFRDRILRIVPAYYAVLALCLIGFFPGFAIASVAPGESLVAHLLFLQDYTGSDINVVFWSLGVEEKFYILAPVVVLLLLKVRTRTQGALLALTLLLVSPLSRGLAFVSAEGPVSYQEFFHLARSPFHMSLEGFVVGILAALALSRGWNLSRSDARLGLAGTGGVLITLLASHDFHAAITAYDAWLQPTILALLFGAMLLFAASLGEADLPFEPFFRVNARLSYALYLVHFPLLPLALHFSKGHNAAVFWASYLALSYAAALALHFGIEKPFLILKDRVSKRAVVPGAMAGTGVIAS